MFYYDLNSYKNIKKKLPDTTGLDISGRNLFGESKYSLKAKLDKPLHIAVQKDGSKVYVLSVKYGKKSYMGNFGQYLNSKFYWEHTKSKPEYNIMDIVDNNPIYTISNSGKIDFLHEDNADFYNCDSYGKIDTNDLDSLYIEAKKTKSTNNIIKQANLDEDTRNKIELSLHNILEIMLENSGKNLHMSTMKINSKGEIFLTLTNQHQVWKISPKKKPEIFAGYIDYLNCDNNYQEDFEIKSGFKDGKGTNALFSYPTGIAIDGQDNLYIADTGNNAIRKITPCGVVSTFYVEKNSSY